MGGYILTVEVSDLAFTVVGWANGDEQDTYVLATARYVTVARAAFDSAIETRPSWTISLRKGSRVMAEHTPEKNAA